MNRLAVAVAMAMAIVAFPAEAKKDRPPTANDECKATYDAAVAQAKAEYNDAIAACVAARDAAPKDQRREAQRAYKDCSNGASTALTSATKKASSDLNACRRGK